MYICEKMRIPLSFVRTFVAVFLMLVMRSSNWFFRSSDDVGEDRMDEWIRLTSSISMLIFWIISLTEWTSSKKGSNADGVWWLDWCMVKDPIPPVGFSKSMVTELKSWLLSTDDWLSCPVWSRRNSAVRSFMMIIIVVAAAAAGF